MARIDSPRTDIAPALRALLADSVDYAGTFPPASLSLDKAIQNFAAYRQLDDAWMLGRFICPAVRLDELRPYQDLFAAHPPFRFSVLAGDGDRAEPFLETFGRQADLTAAFTSDLGDVVRIDSLEMRLPRSVLSTDVITVRRFIDQLDTTLRQAALQPHDIFLELPLDENVRQTVPIVTGAVHAFSRELAEANHGVAGIKLRTGGIEPEAIPSLQSLAHAVSACRSSSVRFKATAGLHHPLRHRDKGIGAEMHGFLNLFVAAVLSSSTQLDESQIIDILSEGSAEAFSFTDEGIGWKGLGVDIQAIEKARSRLIVSFGSCSFEEPAQDLRTLGLL